MSTKGNAILAFGAHAGDMEITAGATILKYTLMGGRAMIVIALKPSGVWAKPPHLTIEQYADIRYRQAFEVGRSLGAEVRFLGYKEGEPVDNEQMRQKVCDIIREFKPDIILTHWKGSYHLDHILTFLNVSRGIEMAGSTDVWTFLPPHMVKGLFFPENREDPQGFQPDVYVNISDTFDKYVAAISQYDFTSGVYSGFNYIQYYSSLYKIRGLESGFRYAQAFMIPDEWGARRQKCEFLPI